ncbi:uncharacterized protein IL334_007059 [Kwoniella shivajii]|uniref:Zn(2)-C6 fungal-type domain-containing protein n=1 Tax=Kwoniella shivajii TaxID=564305 RepID=A0ABZ1D837_9TREE|nr:hypothetical protein IL334_007059 [Kwoniella shivajii]
MLSSRRSKQSCTECRRRKIRCNRRIPCETCTARGEEDLCEGKAVTQASGDRSFPRMKDFRALAARVAQLENQMSNMQDQGHISQTQTSFSPSHMSMTMPLEANQSAANDVPLPSTVTSPAQSSLSSDLHQAMDQNTGSPMLPFGVVHAAEDSVALVLEDFAMGHIANKERAGRRQDPKISNQLYQAVSKAVSILPDAGRSLFLINFYFTHIDWNTKFNRFASLSKERMSAEVRPEWLTVHLMVLCLSVHLLANSERQILGIRGDQWQEIARGLFLASQDVLFASSFLSRHSIEHLQYDADDAADSHWALIGSAVKIAQNLGLHRLGREDQGSTTKWPKPWQNALHREIGRHVWWNIVFLDWSHALSHGMTYCVHSRQNLTSFPANINTADLTAHTSLSPLPLSQYTTASYTIFRLRFLVLYKEHIDHLVKNQPADYAFLTRMDSRFVALRDGLPTYFQNDENSKRLATELNTPCIVSESIAIRMIAANRLLRLHRPYLVLGYQDPKYRQSTEQCVRSARTLLTLYETARITAPTLVNYWLVLFYAFAAAVVIFIQLCHSDREGREECKILLFRAMDLFRAVREVSAAARNAVVILESLLTAEASLAAEGNYDTLYGHANGGTAPEEDSLFRRAVRRVLSSPPFSELFTVPAPTSTGNTMPWDSAPQHGGQHLGIDGDNMDGMWQGAVHGHASIRQNLGFGLAELASFAPDQALDPILASGDNGELDLESFLATLTS